jgi:hypothetical protein
MKKSSQLSIGSLSFENPRLVAVAALAFQELLRLVAAIAPEIRVQQVTIARGAALLPRSPDRFRRSYRLGQRCPSRLLLDARRLGVALVTISRRSWCETPRHFAHRLTEKIAEADAAIVDRSARKMPHRYREAYGTEVRPSSGSTLIAVRT